MSAESHFMSIRIEHKLSSIFNCDRFGFGGIVNSDSIERNPISAFYIGLAGVYNQKNNVEKKNIDNFVEELYQYENMRIDEIGVSVVEDLLNKFDDLI